MAITAAITLSTATMTAPNGVTNATCTVSNSGGTAVNVVGLKPLVNVTGALTRSVAAAHGSGAVGPGVTVAVPAGGTLTFPFSVICYAPQNGTLASPGPNATSQAYDVGANVICQDGSIVDASVATVTVSVPTH